MLEDQYVLAPGEERTVYNTNESSTDTIETFELRWAVGNETGTERIVTHRCYGNVYVVIQADGGASSWHTVC